MEYSDSPRKSSFNRPTLLIIIMGFGLYLWMTRFKNQPPHAATPQEIEQLKTLGIAHMENLDHGQADALLLKLAEIVPSERLGFQNLSVTRLLAAQPENRQAHHTPEDQQRFVERAELAVLTLVERFPGHEDTRVLASRFARLVNDNNRALQELELALKAAPQNPAIHYEFYALCKESEDPDFLAKGAASLKTAVQFAPRNMFLLTELALQQAKSSDTELKQTLTTAKEMFGPFVQKVKKSTNIDLHEHIEKTLKRLDDAQADASAWNNIRANVSIMVNVLRSEVARQLDEKRVSKHLLEFVVDDFSPAYYTANGRPEVKPLKGIEVQLKPEPNQFPSVKDAKQIRLADFNLDGRVDVCVTSSQRLTVWTQDNNKWREIASQDLPEGTRGAVYFDLDRDRNVLAGFKTREGGECADSSLDVITFGANGLQVWRNEAGKDGHRTLSAVTKAGEVTALQDVHAVLPIDFDHDGDLDLIVSAKSGLTLWSNRDDSSFNNVTSFSALPPQEQSIQQLIAVDWNRNVSVDVVCLGAQGAGLLENVLHGQFRWQEFAKTEKAFANASNMALIDADANFSWDLVIGGPKSVNYVRTRNPDGGVTQIVGQREVDASANARVAVWDYDNDGLQDLLIASGTKLQTLRGGPAAAFELQAALTITADSMIDGLDTEDLDGDGDLDVAIVTQQGVSIFKNEGGNANRSLRLPIRGEDAKEAQRPNERVNLLGIGSLVELRTKSHYVPQIVTRQWTHFGLGQQDDAEALRVLWTNGVPENFIGPKAGQSICMQQKLKGSCPYLYTWDGRQMSFFTDCLWAAPVGLQFAEGVLAPTRDWEYLKIDGDRLKPKDGEYQLSLTEELWEIGYIDSMRLLAVDHPADVDIFSNEKVGPAELAEFRIHTVKQKRQPVAARDQKGRDVLPLIKSRDDQFVRAFDHRIKQGLTEPHHIELELGNLKGARSIKMFMTGWMKPTDTSLNIAISQRPDLEATQPPSIWVPDDKGEWQQVRPFMGFPGGKTKTIVVDLSKAFLTDDYRLRVATTMEIYWDHIFFTVDEDDIEVRQTEQPLIAAELQYRGFSVQAPHPQFGPERYDYSRLAPLTSWPPLEGRLTGYGDVAKLVRAQDSRQVVLGAGDELRVKFQATGDVPNGWTRDFILHNVGWDKDADLNTVYGQTVDPLPYVGMRGYPDPEGLPATESTPEAHQTRPQSRIKFWRHLFDASQLPMLK